MTEFAHRGLLATLPSKHLADCDLIDRIPHATSGEARGICGPVIPHGRIAIRVSATRGKALPDER